MDQHARTLLEKDLFASHIGIQLISVYQGEAVAEMEVRPYHLNGVGVIQGGALFTLADFAFAAASNSRGGVAVALQANISFFKGISGGKLTATASELKSGKTISNYEVRITDENENLIAHFNGTAFVKRDAGTQ